MTEQRRKCVRKTDRKVYVKIANSDRIPMWDHLVKIGCSGYLFESKIWANFILSFV